jgi:hypothetical protein
MRIFSKPAIVQPPEQTANEKFEAAVLELQTSDLALEVICRQIADWHSRNLDRRTMSFNNEMAVLLGAQDMHPDLRSLESRRDAIISARKFSLQKYANAKFREGQL